ncbi:MAG: divergent polysaccharide deacetylase family protein [Alphaproteobacteria bacterium]|nr:divergent polysaccharide deacetylase family protein [Alphaproteobacteria bacterium]
MAGLRPALRPRGQATAHRGGGGQSGPGRGADRGRHPGGVTLAFSPYAGPKLPQWAELARVAGHEVLMGVPMEPANYPESDPGPHTLLTTLPAPQNIERLHWVLGRTTGYVGIMNQMGQRFTANADALRPVMVELKGRGLLVLDTRAAAKSAVGQVAGELDMPRAANDRTIDAVPSRDAIAQRLAEVEAIAKKRGAAIAIGSPFPVTIELLEAWTRNLAERGFALAPVSAVAATGPEK